MPWIAYSSTENAYPIFRISVESFLTAVIIYADKPAYAAISGHYPETLLQHANENSFGTEFLDYKMSIRTVSSLDEALAHIAHYSSKHSESIISENPVISRCRLRIRKCIYRLYRWGSIWIRGEDRHQYPKATCPGTNGAS